MLTIMLEGGLVGWLEEVTWGDPYSDRHQQKKKDSDAHFEAREK